jgi:hypothetical protein
VSQNDTDMLIVYTLVANSINVVRKWLPGYFTPTIRFRKEVLFCLKVLPDIKRLELA